MSGAAPLRRVWGMPLLLAGLSIFGLLAALLGSGIWHWLAWLALVVPLLVMAWYTRPARKRSARHE